MIASLIGFLSPLPAVMPPRARVAHVIHSGGFYGAERVVHDLMRVQAASALGPAPILIALLDPGLASNEISDRVAALGLPVVRLSVTPGLSFRGLRAYADALAASGAELVHSHGYKPTVFHFLSRWLGLQRLPLLVTAHGYPKSSGNWKATLYRSLDIALLGAAEGVAAVSGEMRAYLSARNPACRPFTIPNGVPGEVELAGTHPLRAFLAREGGWNGEPVIGSAGRLVPMKNHALLIRAYARVRARVPCRLVILGDGPLRGELEALWRELIPEEAPRLVPFQSDVLDWMADMDVFSLPSLDGEGLPMALLEAGLLERAVACSDSGGMAEIIRDGENGRRFRMGDLDGLEAALSDLAEDQGKRARYGAALRRDVLTRHDIRSTHKRYAEAYAEILANR
jgi:glycosyltransferase involved in cell wall biosynthesis